MRVIKSEWIRNHQTQRNEIISLNRRNDNIHSIMHFNKFNITLSLLAFFSFFLFLSLSLSHCYSFLLNFFLFSSLLFHFSFNLCWYIFSNLTFELLHSSIQCKRRILLFNQQTTMIIDYIYMCTDMLKTCLWF